MRPLAAACTACFSSIAPARQETSCNTAQFGSRLKRHSRETFAAAHPLLETPRARKSITLAVIPALADHTALESSGNK
jgi:hypothetical protein